MTLPTDFHRYAVYYAPPAGLALAALGAAWLGVDPDTGEAVSPDGLIPAEALAALPLPRERLVRKARVYGFHATLKAPFRLAEDIAFETLDGAVAALAARTAPVTAPALALKADLGFVALQTSDAAPEIDALAAACVTDLDLMRAPLTGAEVARRRRGGLDTQEEQHLRNWGYPYVLDRFRFHMTLSTQLSRMEAEQVAAVLEPLFEPHLDSPFRIEEIALFGDPGEGEPFRIVRRYRLGGEA
jgi:putative phosphonate metabolism protein